MVRSEAMICLMFSRFSTMHFSLLAVPANISNNHAGATTAASHGLAVACDKRPANVLGNELGPCRRMMSEG